MTNKTKTPYSALEAILKGKETFGQSVVDKLSQTLGGDNPTHWLMAGLLLSASRGNARATERIFKIMEGGGLKEAVARLDKKTAEDLLGPDATKCNPKQRALLQAFFKVGDRLNAACEMVGIHRATYWRWCEDENYARLSDLAKQIGEEIRLEAAEAKLDDLVQKGDTQSLKFYLSSKGRSKGYGESVHHTHTMSAHDDFVLNQLPAIQAKQKDGSDNNG